MTSLLQQQQKLLEEKINELMQLVRQARDMLADATTRFVRACKQLGLT